MSETFTETAAPEQSAPEPAPLPELQAGGEAEAQRMTESWEADRVDVADAWRGRESRAGAKPETPVEPKAPEWTAQEVYRKVGVDQTAAEQFALAVPQIADDPRFIPDPQTPRELEANVRGVLEYAAAVQAQQDAQRQAQSEALLAEAVELYETGEATGGDLANQLVHHLGATDPAVARFVEVWGADDPVGGLTFNGELARGLNELAKQAQTIEYIAVAAEAERQSYEHAKGMRDVAARFLTEHPEAVALEQTFNMGPLTATTPDGVREQLEVRLATARAMAQSIFDANEQNRTLGNLVSTGVVRGEDGQLRDWRGNPVADIQPAPVDIGRVVGQVTGQTAAPVNAWDGYAQEMTALAFAAGKPHLAPQAAAPMDPAQAQQWAADANSMQAAWKGRDSRGARRTLAQERRMRTGSR